MGNNEVQGSVTLNLLYKTDMNVEEFLHTFNDDNIIDLKVVVTLSNGSIHTISCAEYVKGIINSFIVDDEELVEEEIDMKNVVELKKKVTKSNDSVTKIAL